MHNIELSTEHVHIKKYTVNDGEGILEFSLVIEQLNQAVTEVLESSEYINGVNKVEYTSVEPIRDKEGISSETLEGALLNNSFTFVSASSAVRQLR